MYTLSYIGRMILLALIAHAIAFVLSRMFGFKMYTDKPPQPIPLGDKEGLKHWQTEIRKSYIIFVVSFIVLLISLSAWVFAGGMPLFL